ncbi:MAG: hypothetical protein ABIO70_15615 [Pseudomonadota bacterium]
MSSVDAVMDRVRAGRRVHDVEALDELARLSGGRVRVRVVQRLPGGAPARVEVTFDLVTAISRQPGDPPEAAHATPTLVLDLTGAYPIEQPAFELRCPMPLFLPAVAGLREMSAAVAAAFGRPAPDLPEPVGLPKKICLLRSDGWRPLEMDLEFLVRQAWRVLTLCPQHLNALNDRMNWAAAEYWAHHQAEWTLPLAPPLPEPPPQARCRTPGAPGAFVLEDAP